MSQPVRVRVLDACRLVEGFFLVLLGLLAVVQHALMGGLIAILLMSVAVILFPRARAVPPSREEVRRALIEKLELEGKRLAVAAEYAWYTQDQRLIRESEAQTEKWNKAARAALKPFPEFKGIFEAQPNSSTGTLLLQPRLQALARMRKLIRISEAMTLPL